MGEGAMFIATLMATYSAPAIIGFARGRYGRAVAVFFVPLIPLTLENILPIWLIWVLFFSAWLGLAFYANTPLKSEKDPNAGSELPPAERKPNEPKWPMLKWVLLPPALVIGAIVLIAFIVQMSR